MRLLVDVLPLISCKIYIYICSCLFKVLCVYDVLYCFWMVKMKHVSVSRQKQKTSVSLPLDSCSPS